MSLKEIIVKNVDEIADKACNLNDRIFEFAEPGFGEYKSADLFCTMLEYEGFTVERNVAGIATAFKASVGKGAPFIGLLAEYDALPGLSQKSGYTEKEPVKEDGYGHGCGHCALGAGVFAAALAVKKYLQKENKAGTIEVYGCPAEEIGSGKAFMVKEGVFAHLDAAVTWHPSWMNGVTTTRWASLVTVDFDFCGTASHAAAAPELGRSSLDACELMNVGINYLREHLSKDAGIQYAYLDAGCKTPNVIPDYASTRYIIRARKIAGVSETFGRVKDVAEGAALMTGTAMKYKIRSVYADFIPNDTLSRIMDDAVYEIGPAVYEDEDYAMAMSFWNLNSDEEKNAIINDYVNEFDESFSEDICEKPVNRYLRRCSYKPKYQGVSTDVGNIGYLVPTVLLSHVISSLDTPAHTWKQTAQTATGLAHKGLLNAGKIMALTCCKLFEYPQHLSDAALEKRKYNCEDKQKLDELTKKLVYDKNVLI